MLQHRVCVCVWCVFLVEPLDNERKHQYFQSALLPNVCVCVCVCPTRVCALDRRKWKWKKWNEMNEKKNWIYVRRYPKIWYRMEGYPIQRFVVFAPAYAARPMREQAKLLCSIHTGEMTTLWTLKSIIFSCWMCHCRWHVDVGNNRIEVQVGPYLKTHFFIFSAPHTPPPPSIFPSLMCRSVNISNIDS